MWLLFADIFSCLDQQPKLKAHSPVNISLLSNKTLFVMCESVVLISTCKATWVFDDTQEQSFWGGVVSSLGMQEGEIPLITCLNSDSWKLRSAYLQTCKCIQNRLGKTTKWHKKWDKLPSQVWFLSAYQPVFIAWIFNAFALCKSFSLSLPCL